MTILCTLLAGACAAPLLLPAGTYTNGSGVTLTVEGRDLRFKGGVDDPGVVTSGTTCGYRLDEDGTLQLYGTSNSSYYVFWVLDRQWRWTGTALESRNRRDGTVVTYTPVH